MTPDLHAVLRATPGFTQLADTAGTIATRLHDMAPPFVARRLDTLKAMGLVMLSGGYWSRTELGDREANRRLA